MATESWESRTEDSEEQSLESGSEYDESGSVTASMVSDSQRSQSHSHASSMSWTNGHGRHKQYGRQNRSFEDPAQRLKEGISTFTTYRSEINDPSHADAVARAGGLLRKAMLAEGQLQTTFDALSSGQQSLEHDNILERQRRQNAQEAEAAMPQNKSIAKLEAELEVVNKRLARLRERKAGGGTNPDTRPQLSSIQSRLTEYDSDDSSAVDPRHGAAWAGPNALANQPRSNLNAPPPRPESRGPGEKGTVNPQRAVQGRGQGGRSGPPQGESEEGSESESRDSEWGGGRGAGVRQVSVPVRPWEGGGGGEQGEALEVVLSDQLRRSREDLAEQRAKTDALQRNVKELMSQLRKRDETIQHLFALVSERDFTIAMLKQNPAAAPAEMVLDAPVGASALRKKKNAKTAGGKAARGSELDARGTSEDVEEARGVHRPVTFAAHNTSSRKDRGRGGAEGGAGTGFKSMVLLDRDCNLRYSVTSFQEPFTVGRSGGCSLVLDHKQHPSVSRVHATVYFDPETHVFNIKDTSTSGSAVNDDGFQNETFKDLQVGDVITVGGAATGKQLTVESITDSPQG